MTRFLFFFGLSIMSVPHINAQWQEKVIAVQVSADLPVVGEDGTILFREIDSTDIYYYKDFILQDISYQYSEMDMRYEKEDEQLKKLETRHFYLVYTRDSLFGYIFYQDEGKTDKWELVEKSISGPSALNMDLNKIYLSTRILSSTIDAATGDIHEIHVSKTAEYLQDTITFVYTSSMPDVPFTFDKQLDSTKGKKVRTIKITNGAQHIKERNITLPYRVNMIELKRIPAQNEQEIISYFNRFAKLRRPQTEKQP